MILDLPAPDPLLCSIFVFVAFVLAGSAQTWWLRSRRSARFAIPLDAGRTCRGRRIFGENKTWRGFVVMVPATGASFALVRAVSRLDANWHSEMWELSVGLYFLLGCWTGIGFMLGELPNSFLKRQFDIGPGNAPSNPATRILCFTIDQVDSIVGGLIALWLFVPVPLVSWLLILAVGALIHWCFNLVLVLLGLKVRAA